MPEEFLYLWDMYNEITGYHFGVEPLVWQDLAGYSSVRGITLSSFEASVLIEIDRLGAESVKAKPE